MTKNLWPEVPRPSSEIPCDQCELVHQSPRLIWGEGNPEASLWVLLDNPGAREDREQNPFVCGARETLYELAHSAGFLPEHIYITYVLRRRPRRAYDKPTERQRCLQNFHNELAISKPKMIFCLGDVALQNFTTNTTRFVKQARQHWWEQSGIAVSASYHPLAVRRRPSLRDYAYADWQLCYTRYNDSSSE